MTVVGDDAQSIYSFRAATVRNILDFPGHFTPPAEIVTLDRNYRSTQPILTAANAVISEATERFTKNLWTERLSIDKPLLVTVKDEADQARYVTEEVLATREGGTPLKQQAVLFRSSSHSGPLEIELTRRNIPVREVRRPEVPRCGARQGHAGAAALRRESARPRRRFPHPQPAARHRAEHRRPASSTTSRPRRARSSASPRPLPRRGPPRAGRTSCG